jgi:hypothetical protein
MVMDSSASTRQLQALWAILFAVLGLSVWVRFGQLMGTMALQDSVGPYLAAIRMDGRAHTPAYGAGLLVPYWLSVQVASSLWGAAGVMAVFHSLAAPIASGLAWTINRYRWGPALLVGVLVALDPGLLDTAKSGAEGYLAPALIGLAVLVRGPWAWLALGLAVANHPMALCGLPLVLRSDTCRTSALWGFGLAAVAVGSQAAGWGSPGVDGGGATLLGAAETYVKTGGGFAVLAGMGPLAGLLSSRTRPLAFRLLAAVAILALMGAHLGYIRDHHLRLLTVPALACWVVLPGASVWAIALAPLALPGPSMPPEVLMRGGTLGLVDTLGSRLHAGHSRLVVDRMWVGGGPAIEPAAVMLDLHLRGWRAAQFDLEADKVIIIATPQGGPAVGHPGKLLLSGQGYVVSMAATDQVRAWSRGPCAKGGKPGGAWDAMSVFHPGLSTEQVSAWWACR